MRSATARSRWWSDTTPARRSRPGARSFAPTSSARSVIMSSPFEGPPACRSTPRTARRRHARHDRRRARRRAREARPGRGNTIRTISARPAPTTTCCMRRRACTRSFAPITTTRAPTGQGTIRIPLKARTAEEMAKIPTYYVMEKDKGMAETVAPFMPSAAEIAACKWLTEADVGVYATEYARTASPARCKAIACGAGPTRKSKAEMRTFSGRTIDVPSSSSREERLGHLPDAGRGRHACAARPAPGWWGSIWSTARDIGCSRSSPSR